MTEYHLRIIDDELDEVFPALAAVAIDGPKGVGKTATATRRATTIIALDQLARAQELAADPGFMERAPKPLLLDEWQRLPQVWDMVRRSVDHDRSGAQFLLTGSAGDHSDALGGWPHCEPASAPALGGGARRARSAIGTC
ncbi:AAA family ATPase [Leucobacter weissii]|uniref:AAA family ATPase n=1 Tax=Leucobacter weissii TaxID=1983706 RepID=UPI001FB834AF|nr:AAA family ATPase [Leucobacter weissii]